MQGIPVNGGPKFNYCVKCYRTILYAWRRGSFRVQQLGLLPVIVIEFGTAVYRIAKCGPGTQTWSAVYPYAGPHFTHARSTECQVIASKRMQSSLQLIRSGSWAELELLQPPDALTIRPRYYSKYTHKSPLKIRIYLLTGTLPIVSQTAQLSDALDAAVKIE